MLIQKLHEFPDRAIEWLLGFILLSWGIIVLWHPDMFSSSPVYNGWRHITQDQQMWGLVASTTGAARLAALYINGAHRRTPTVRVLTSFLSMFVWFWVVVGMLIVDINTGLAVYPWLMVGEAFSVYRASGDAYLARQGVAASAGKH